MMVMQSRFFLHERRCTAAAVHNLLKDMASVKFCQHTAISIELYEISFSSIREKPQFPRKSIKLYGKFSVSLK